MSLGILFSKGLRLDSANGPIVAPTPRRHKQARHLEAGAPGGFSPVPGSGIAAWGLSPRWSAFAIAWLAMVVAGCASLPPNPERPATSALPPSPDSPLVRIARNSTPASDLSGFRVMPLGAYSLDARIELAHRARVSIDAQYYHIHNDGAGRLFLRSLRDAANRGVRVRLLVDDLYTADAEPLLRGLAAFPNVEVRLFNPFCCARGGVLSRFLASPLEFRRLNRRMHNKLFIADGTLAVAGGRNIGD